MDLALDTGLLKTLGFRFDEAEPNRVRIAWTVDDRQLQPAGVVHGGVYSAVVETAASVGAQLWLGDRGRVVGVSEPDRLPACAAAFGSAPERRRGADPPGAQPAAVAGRGPGRGRPACRTRPGGLQNLTEPAPG